MHHVIDEPALIEQARRALAQRIARDGRRDIQTVPHTRAACPSCADRRTKSLQRRCVPVDRKTAPAPRPSNGYVPELADAIDRDMRLTDGARRCARIIAAQAYRKHREDRSLPVTVSYLCMALGRARRTVQGYLRQLEAAGYIDVHVVMSARTRMCRGLLVRLCTALFPRHGWPQKAIKPGAQFAAHIYRKDIYKRPIPRAEWWERCRNGMDRVLMALAGPPPEALRL